MCCFNNYRLISLLPTIFKHVLFYNYTQFFNVNNSEQQYSFRLQASSNLKALKNHFRYFSGYYLTHRKLFFRQTHIFNNRVFRNCMLSIRKPYVNLFYH